MAHLFRPSAQQDVGLVVPTDRRPNSPQAPWQAHAGQPRLLKIKLALSLSRLAALPPRFLQKEKGGAEGGVCQSPRSRDKPNATHIQTRFKDRDARRRQSPLEPVPRWQGPLLCHQQEDSALKRRRDSTEEKTGWEGKKAET